MIPWPYFALALAALAIVSALLALYVARCRDLARVNGRQAAVIADLRTAAALEGTGGDVHWRQDKD